MALGPGGVERARVSLKVVPDLSDVYDGVAEALVDIEMSKATLTVKLDIEKINDIQDLVADEVARVQVVFWTNQTVSDLIEPTTDVDVDLNVREDVQDNIDLPDDHDVLVHYLSDLTDILAGFEEVKAFGQGMADEIDGALGNVGLTMADTIMASMGDAMDRIRKDMERLRRDMAKPLKIPTGTKNKAKTIAELEALLAELQALADAQPVDIPTDLDQDIKKPTWINAVYDAAQGLKALTSGDGVNRLNREFRALPSSVNLARKAIGAAARDIKKEFGKDIVIKARADVDTTSFVRAQATVHSLIDLLKMQRGGGIQIPIEFNIDQESFAKAKLALAMMKHDLEHPGVQVPIRAAIEQNPMRNAMGYFREIGARAGGAAGKAWSSSFQDAAGNFTSSHHGKGLVRWAETLGEDMGNSAGRNFTESMRSHLDDLKWAKDIGDLPSFGKQFALPPGTWKPPVPKDYWANFKKASEGAFSAFGDAFKKAQESMEADAKKGGGRFASAFGRGLRGGMISVRRLWTNMFTARFWMQAAAVGGIGAGGDLLTIGAGLKGLAGGLAAIPAVATAAGGSLATVKVGLFGVAEGLQAAASGDDEWLAEALNRMAKSAGEFVLAVRDISPAWADMRKKVQQNLFEGLGPALRDMSRNILPDLTKGLQGMADGWNSIARNAMAAVGEMGKNKQLSAIFGNLGKGFQSAGRGVGQFLLAFADLSEVGAKYAPGIGRAFSQMMADFRNWIAEAKKTGQIDRWFATFKATVLDLGTAVKSVGRILAGFTDAAQAAGGATLHEFAQGLKSIADVVQGHNFQQALYEMFKGVSDGLNSIFAEAGPSFKKFAGQAAYSFGQIARALGPVVGTGLKALFEFLLAALPGLVEGVRAAAPGLQKLMEAFAKLSPEAGQVLGKALTQIGGAIGGIAEAIAASMDAGGPNVLLDIISMFGRFAEAVGKIARAVAPVLPIIGTLFNYLWKFTVGGLLDSIVGIAEGIADIFDGLRKILTGDVLGGLSSIVGGLVKGIWSAITLALSFLGMGWLSKVLGPLKLLLPHGMGLAMKFAEIFNGTVIRGLTKMFPFLDGLGGKILAKLKWPFTKIKEFLDGFAGKLFQPIGAAFDGFVTKINTIAPKLGEWLSKPFTSLPALVRAGLATALAAIMGFFSSISASAADFGNDVSNNIGGGFKRAFDQAVTWLQGIVNRIIQFGNDAMRNVVTILRNIAGQFLAWFRQAYAWTAGQLTAIVTRIVQFGNDAMGKLVTILRNLAGQFLAWFRQAVAWATQQLNNLLRNIIQWGNNAIRAVTTIVRNIANTILRWFRQAWVWAAQMLKNIYNSIVAWGRNWVRAIANAGRNIVASISYWFKRAYNTVVAWLVAIGRYIAGVGRTWVAAISNGLKGLAAAMKKPFEDGWAGVWEFLKSIPGKLFDLGKSIVQGLWNGIKEAFSTDDPLTRANMRMWGNLLRFWDVNSPSRRMRGLGDSIGEGFHDGVDRSIDPDGAIPLMQALFDSVLQFWDINSPSKKMADVGENVGLGFGQGFNDTKPYLLNQLRTFTRDYKRAAQDEVAKQFRDLGRYVGSEFGKAFSGTFDDVTGAMGDLIERLGSMSDAIWERTNNKADSLNEQLGNLNEKIADQNAAIKEAVKVDAKAATTNAAKIDIETEKLRLMQEQLRLQKAAVETAKKGTIRDNTDAIKREQTTRQSILDQIAREQKEIARLSQLRGKTAKEQVGYNQRIRALNDQIAAQRKRVAASDERIARLQAENGKKRAESAAQRQARIDAANLAVKRQQLAIQEQMAKIAGLEGKGDQSATAKAKKKLADLLKDKRTLEADIKKLIEEGRKQEAAMEWAKSYVEAMQVVVGGLAQQRDKIREQLEKAQADLDEWNSKIKDFVESVRSSITSAVNITATFDAAELGKGVGQDFIDGLNRVIAGADPKSGVADLAATFQKRMAASMSGASGESVDAVMEAFKTQLEALGPQLGSSEAMLIDKLKSILTTTTSKTLIPGMGQVIDRARNQLDQVKSFSDTVKRLIGMGLNKTSLQQIIEAGPFSDMANVWKDANKGQVDELNNIMATIDEYAKDIGVNGAEALFGAGRDAAAALVAGLKSQEEALTKQIDRIVAAIERAIEVAAGVSVPDLVGRTPAAPTAATPGANADGTYAPIVARPVVNVTAQIGDRQITDLIVHTTYNAMTGAAQAAGARNGF